MSEQNIPAFVSGTATNIINDRTSATGTFAHAIDTNQLYVKHATGWSQYTLDSPMGEYTYPGTDSLMSTSPVMHIDLSDENTKMFDHRGVDVKHASSINKRVRKLIPSIGGFELNSFETRDPGNGNLFTNGIAHATRGPLYVPATETEPAHLKFGIDGFGGVNPPAREYEPGSSLCTTDRHVNDRRLEHEFTMFMVVKLHRLYKDWGNKEFLTRNPYGDDAANQQTVFWSGATEWSNDSYSQVPFDQPMSMAYINNENTVGFMVKLPEHTWSLNEVKITSLKVDVYSKYFVLCQRLMSTTGNVDPKRFVTEPRFNSGTKGVIETNVNGLDGTTNNTDILTNANFNMRGLRIGGDEGGFDLVEMLYFNELLTDDNVNKIGTALCEKWDCPAWK